MAASEREEGGKLAATSMWLDILAALLSTSPPERDENHKVERQG